MRRSEERILTTHTGSLPRPPELTRLYVRRARGESFDTAEIENLGLAALRGIVKKQAEAGVDIANNGEQQREGFFLHIRHRMSGFGGSWQRRTRADALRYPVFRQMMEQQLAAREAVSNMGPPKAIGEVRYLGPAAIEAECADFQAALDETGTHFVEPFLTAPSPGIIAGAMKNEYYDSEEAYLAALATALRGEYETIVRRGFLLQLDCPDLALERHLSYQDRPLGEFLGFVERVVTAINTALANIPRDKVRLHVCWGNYEGPHDSDVPLADILPIIQKANVGGFFFPFANPRHAPYGRAAEAALKSLKVYDSVKDRLVLGENVAQAAQFVQSGAADAGVFSRSLALAPALRDAGNFWEVPENAYPRLEQGGLILPWAEDPAAAAALRDFLLGSEGRAVLKRFGFDSPGE